MIFDPFLTSKYIKNGAPASDVIIPTGNSPGLTIVRATRSDRTRKQPPISADIGIKFRKSLPQRSLAAVSYTHLTLPTILLV